MENLTITIYTDTDNRVWMSQDEDNTRTPHEVAELPAIPTRPTDANLYDGHHIYLDGVVSFGYELNANKCYGAMNDCRAELSKSDYIALKAQDGEDVTSYADYKAVRNASRCEINRIEQLLNTIEPC